MIWVDENQEDFITLFQREFGNDMFTRFIRGPIVSVIHWLINQPKEVKRFDGKYQGRCALTIKTPDD